MGNIFSDRISDVPRSFIREILKFTIDESVISFAGGLPNRDLFPVEEIKAATQKVLVQQKVAFVPGDPFYVNKKGVNTLRLNYSSVDPETIRVGIKRLGKVLKDMLS